jgi:hypothetical protein
MYQFCSQRRVAEIATELVAKRNNRCSCPFSACRLSGEGEPERVSGRADSIGQTL